MTRYALIDSMLANRHKAVSIQDITDFVNEHLPEFGIDEGVSKRCIEKDIEYLEWSSPFSVELERYSIDATTVNDRVYKKRCLRYADPTFSIFKKKLTQDEKAVLESALTTLGSFDGLDNFEWLAELRKQLKVEERKPIISLSKNLVENSTLIASLFSAISNEQVVELTYRKFLDSTERKVIISPYLLKEYNRRWYIVGGAYDTNRVLNFALDRLVEIEFKTGYTFKPCETDLEERFEEIIGVTFNEEVPLTQILFWVSDAIKGYIHTKPIHGSQIHIKGDRADKLHILYPQLQSGDFLTIECRENFELIRELTAWGDDLIVLTPVSLRDRIVDRINRMKTRYQSFS
ncbi:MAG: WYL domain-containing protein [Bacteroidales bacterium]|nr:WYL domain-containing protein [Bacteroidales bacterium]